MKKTILGLILLVSTSIFAQKAVSSTIKNVTVYKQNAEIARHATVSVKAGKQEIVLTGISTAINPASLQVKFVGANAMLLSVKYEQNYLIDQPENSKITALKKQLETIDDQISWNAVKKKSLKGMLAILEKNQDLGGANAGFTPSQVVALANTYKAKYLEVQKDLFAVVKKEKTWYESKQKLTKQLNEINGKYNRPSGNIVIVLSAQQAGKINLSAKYIVRNAGWRPLYDLRSNGISEDVKLAYKANVYQNTGQDWDNVKMRVSTGNPSQNNNRPILSPLYASIYNSSRYRDDESLDEIVVEAAPVFNMALKRKGRAAGDSYGYTAEVSQNQLNVFFELTGRQTIASDGKKNALALKQYKLKTTYSYHAVPKLSKGAFLLAKISDWTKYNLVAGNANIFFEGVYVGKTYINPEVSSDELLISMGRDNGIVIEREPVTFASSKFIGTNKKESFAYKITVKNKKNKAITIEVLDQIPVSQDKSIVITLDEKGTAEYTAAIGKLLWNLTLNPGQSKTVTFKYTIKYPKKAQVQGKR
jgi:uncharacterized protein (TIGR02231 family)